MNITSIDSLTKLTENLSWFKDHLDAIRTHTHAPRIGLKVHVSKPDPIQVDEESISRKEDLSEKPSTRTLVRKNSQSSADMTPITPTEKDIEKFPETLPIVGLKDDPEKGDVRAVVFHMGRETEATGAVELPIKQGRPDIAALLRDAVNSVDKNKRVLIAACGPDGLMKIVRNTAADLITNDGPSVELHCEQFGW